MKSEALTMITVIFTAVVATFFILMAFQINQIINIIQDIVKKIIAKLWPKKGSPAADEKNVGREETDQKGHALTSAEPVANPRARRSWSIIKRQYKEKHSPEP
jgi:hypothetical protein